MFKTVKFKISLLVVSFLGMFIFIFTKPIMIQSQDYHQFIDTRSLMGIPNAGDVLTNILFLIVGWFGIQQKEKSKAWSWFFISIALIGPGSAYYHWHPNNDTLVWDRLPMSMGFMALYVIMLSEHISEKAEKYLIPALLIGLSSVLVWVMTTDLRFYFWVQFSSFISIPLILILFPSRYSGKQWYIFTLLFYALAKVTEIKDKEVFELTSGLISGHSLKHILAAIGLLGLAIMLKTRTHLSSGARNP